MNPTTNAFANPELLINDDPSSSGNPSLVEATSFIGAIDQIEPDALAVELSGISGNNIGDIPELAASDDFGPMIKEPAKFVERLGDTLKTLGGELTEEGSRGKRFGAFVLGGLTQTLDRARVMVFALPTTFYEVVEHGVTNGYSPYQTGGLAAAAVGGVFYGWSQLVGKSFQVSVNAFPETADKVVENHPVMVDVISKAIDGFPTQSELAETHGEKPEAGYEVSPYETRKSILGKAALALSRGLRTGFLYGSTAHVGVSKVSGHSEKSTSRRRNAVSAEAGVALGGVALGMYTLIHNDALGLAEDIEGAITNEVYLGGASLGLIGIGILSNFLARRKEQKQQSNESEKAEPILSEVPLVA